MKINVDVPVAADATRKLGRDANVTVLVHPGPPERIVRGWVASFGSRHR